MKTLKITTAFVALALLSGTALACPSGPVCSSTGHADHGLGGNGGSGPR